MIKFTSYIIHGKFFIAAEAFTNITLFLLIHRICMIHQFHRCPYNIGSILLRIIFLSNLLIPYIIIHSARILPHHGIQPCMIVYTENWPLSNALPTVLSVPLYFKILVTLSLITLSTQHYIISIVSFRQSSTFHVFAYTFQANIRLNNHPLPNSL